jgi:hypothetical protein
VASGEEEKPQGELIPRRRPATGEARAVGRVLLGTFGGLLGGILGAGPGLGLSLAMERCEGCGNSTGAITAVGLVGVAGGVSGIALGVWGSGSLLGGGGRYLPTLLGVGAGTLVGGGLAVLLAESSSHEENAIPPLIIGPILGGIIGYEISHSLEVDRLERASTGVTLLPTVGVRPSGGVVAGLVGRF